MRRLGKDDERPINVLEDRAAVAAALQSVDLVTWFDADTPLDLILLTRPQVLVKGGDWPVEKIVGAPDVSCPGAGGSIPSRSCSIARPRRPSPASGVPTPREALIKSRMRDRGDLGLAPERGAGALWGCDRAGANQNAVGPGAASRSRVASIGQARWNLLRPPRARKWARTPCSRPTQGGARAAIGPKRPGPSKETNIYRVVSGAAPASLRAGAAWSKGPACGDATVEPALSVSPPASCVSPRSDPQRAPLPRYDTPRQEYLPKASSRGPCIYSPRASIRT